MGISFCKPEPVFKSVKRILLQEDKTVQVIDGELRDLLATYLNPYYRQVECKDYNTVQDCIITILINIKVRCERGEETVPIFGKIVWELSTKIPSYLRSTYNNRVTNAHVGKTYQKIMAIDWKTASAAATPSATDTASNKITFISRHFDHKNINEALMDEFLSGLDQEFDETTPSA